MPVERLGPPFPVSPPLVVDEPVIATGAPGPPIRPAANHDAEAESATSAMPAAASCGQVKEKERATRSADMKERLREFEQLLGESGGEGAQGAAGRGGAERGAAPGGRGSPRSALSEHLHTLMGDAPFCDTCGHITVRNGACYKCLNCGASVGCS